VLQPPDSGGPNPLYRKAKLVIFKQGHHRDPVHVIEAGAWHAACPCGQWAQGEQGKVLLFVATHSAQHHGAVKLETDRAAV
jgi:hypothetical protein